MGRKVDIKKKKKGKKGANDDKDRDRIILFSSE